MRSIIRDFTIDVQHDYSIRVIRKENPMLNTVKIPARFPLIGGLVPGLALLAVIALVARQVPGLTGQSFIGAPVAAMLIGLLLRNTLGMPAGIRPGNTFAMRRLLRFAIVLLGLQVSMPQILGLGWGVLLAVVLTLAATFVFTRMAGRMLGVPAPLTDLIAAGTSVCGASAVMACNTVARGSDEDVAYSIACVSIFGTIAMVVAPLLAAPMQASPEFWGLWVGTTIHEVAQVAGTAFTLGDAAGQSGTIAKLTRVLLLAPLILVLGFGGQRRGGGAVPMPWFAFGFIALALVNPLLGLPEALRETAAQLTAFFLTMALAAMGLEADFSKLRLKGWRPLLLGGVASIFIALFGYLTLAALA